MSATPTCVLFLALAVVCLAAPSVATAADKDQRVYEMRTYYAASGKLESVAVGS